MQKSKRILFINPFGIGDVLFTTPVLRAVKAAYPDSFIGYWCNARTEGLLKNDPHIDKIFALSRGDIKKVYKKSLWRGLKESLRLATDIRREHFDISLDFSLDYRYSLISKFLGIKKRLGFNYKGRGRFLTDRIDIDGYSDKHVVEYYLGLLDAVGVASQGKNLELTVCDVDKKEADDLLAGLGVLQGGMLIGIAPGAGASWGKDAALKRWPELKFKALAEELCRRFNAKIVLLGDESEAGLTARISALPADNILDLAGKLSLSGLAAVINRLGLLIANDGGPLHIAVALGKKTISFFGPVDPLVYGPYPPDPKKHIVLRRELECSPCYRNFRLAACTRARECLEKINIDAAVYAVGMLCKYPS